MRSRRAREEPPIEKERKRPWDRRKRKEGASRPSLSRARAEGREERRAGAVRRRMTTNRRRWRRGNTARREYGGTGGR